jgi:N4-(beta-N-acetylglucosaminyl)-L-asparaginase
VLRDFAGAGLTLAAVGRAAAQTGKPAPADLPVIIATWDYGLDLCTAAQKVFRSGGGVLDALERGVNVVEDDPKVHTVGFGGLPNEDGVVQLDAAIMDGRTHRAGGVAALERVKNPISVARKVMERTEHVLLVGAGALKFARAMGFREQELLTPETRAEWEKQRHSYLRGQAAKSGERHDTVCGLAIDSAGHLASAVSTSGLSGKLAGRVGDSPLIGAGSYVDDEVGAAAATGVGELAMRNLCAFAAVERMRAGMEPTQACRDVLTRVLRKEPGVSANPLMQLALIALDKQGRPGAAALRGDAKKPFRYALARGLTQKPSLSAVAPMLG